MYRSCVWSVIRQCTFVRLVCHPAVYRAARPKHYGASDLGKILHPALCVMKWVGGYGVATLPLATHHLPLATEQLQEMGGLVWGGRVTAAEWRAAADERKAARAAAPERAWAI